MLYAYFYIPYTIIPPIQVISSENSLLSAPGNNFSVQFNLQNYVNVQQNISIQISGTSFDTVSQNAQIAALGTIQTNVPLTFYKSILPGYTTLFINITRNSDNAQLFTGIITCEYSTNFANYFNTKPNANRTRTDGCDYVSTDE